MWEKLSGKSLTKFHIQGDEFLASMKGCLTNFDIGDYGAEATLLYPDVQYTRINEFLKRYL